MHFNRADLQRENYCPSSAACRGNAYAFLLNCALFTRINKRVATRAERYMSARTHTTHEDAPAFNYTNTNTQPRRSKFIGTRILRGACAMSHTHTHTHMY